MSEMQKTLGSPTSFSEPKSVRKFYPDFEKLVHVIQHGLHGI